MAARRTAPGGNRHLNPLAVPGFGKVPDTKNIISLADDEAYIKGKKVDAFASQWWRTDEKKRTSEKKRAADPHEDEPTSKLLKVNLEVPAATKGEKKGQSEAYSEGYFYTTRLESRCGKLAADKMDCMSALDKAVTETMNVKEENQKVKRMNRSLEASQTLRSRVWHEATASR